MIIDLATWAWPQWMLIGMMLFSLFTKCALHGHEHRTSAFAGVIDFLVVVIILAYGGFWS